jgi:hypothetical protein
MSLRDWCFFYLGDAEAIQRLAAGPWTLAVGALLVLSAGLARHHDRHDLGRQWWRLLVPFGISTLAAGGLFVVLALVARVEGADLVPLGPALLALFWLTAPFAWLYGLPFERLYEAEKAARLRRRTVTVVAVCRVGLTARCVSVLVGYGWAESVLIVACFAIPAALAAVGMALFLLRQTEAGKPLEVATDGTAGAAARQVVDFMGVVPADVARARTPVRPPVGRPRLEPPADPGVGIVVGVLAVGLLTLSACVLPNLIGPPPRPLALATAAEPSSPSAVVWVAATLAVLFWAPWLVRHQPAQRRRSLFVHRLRLGPVTETVRDLAGHRPGDFPPHWDPSAALAQEEFAPRLVQAAQAAAGLPIGTWVRNAFLERLGQMLPVWTDSAQLWFDDSDRMPQDQLKELAKVAELLRGVPEGPRLLRPYEDYLADLYSDLRERDPPRGEILERLLALTLKRGSKRRQAEACSEIAKSKPQIHPDQRG